MVVSVSDGFKNTIDVQQTNHAEVVDGVLANAELKPDTDGLETEKRSREREVAHLARLAVVDNRRGRCSVGLLLQMRVSLACWHMAVFRANDFGSWPNHNRRGANEVLEVLEEAEEKTKQNKNPRRVKTNTTVHKQRHNA